MAFNNEFDDLYPSSLLQSTTKQLPTSFSPPHPTPTPTQAPIVERVLRVCCILACMVESTRCLDAPGQQSYRYTQGRDDALIKSDLPPSVYDLYHKIDKEDGVDHIVHHSPISVVPITDDLKHRHTGWLVVYNYTDTFIPQQGFTPPVRSFGVEGKKNEIVRAYFRITRPPSNPGGSYASPSFDVVSKDGERHSLEAMPIVTTRPWVDYDITYDFLSRKYIVDKHLGTLTFILPNLWVDLDSDLETDDIRQSVAFVTHARDPHSEAKRRAKRQAENTRRKQQRERRNRNQHVKGQHNPNRCRRDNLTIEFHNFGWDWIYAPSSYNAYQCRGVCNSVMDATENYSNHAIMQQIIHDVNKTVMPLPCCVPTKMTHLKLMIVDNGNYEVKTYDDMIVEECGCY